MNDNKSIAPLGQQIRELRTRKGWSLAELARRAGTSAAALHRYENGWDRFQVATLQRLAAALGARLEICLVAEEREGDAGKPSASSLRKLLASLFWDVDLTGAHLQDHPQWVLRRVLTFGDRQQVAAARSFYGDEAIRQALAHRAVDDRTRSYWALILEAEGDAPASPAA